MVVTSGEDRHAECLGYGDREPFAWNDPHPAYKCKIAYLPGGLVQ